MSKKSFPSVSPISSVPELNNSVKINTLAKWIPLICAGAAVGVSIIALKEIKHVRDEIVILKKEQFSDNNKILSTKMEQLEAQLKMLNDSLSKKTKTKKVKFNTDPVINVINEETNQESEDEPEAEEEYEEVEVTDSDQD